MLIEKQTTFKSCGHAEIIEMILIRYKVKRVAFISAVSRDVLQMLSNALCILYYRFVLASRQQTKKEEEGEGRQQLGEKK